MSERSRSRSRGRNNPAAGTFPPTIAQQGRSTEFPLRMLVSSEMVGAIIGRGGATIRTITQATRARVDVHRKENIGSVEKAITIYGNPENISQACKKILEVMSQEASSTNKGEISLKLLAHNSLIGRIIGKGGTTIKKIMEETGTKINVSSVSEVSGLNVERVISIRGPIDGMAQAESLISGKLKSSYENDLQALSPVGVSGMFPESYIKGLHPMAMMSTLRPPMPHPAAIQPAPPPYPLFNSNLLNPPGNQQQETVHMYIPNNAVGAIIGTKGSHIRSIIRYSSATVKIATVQGDQKVEERKVTIVGTAEAQWKAQCMIFEKMREEGFVPAHDEPRLTVEISVPSGQVGRIIGKGGSNVRELQRVTGAVIKFPSSETTSNTNTNTENSSTTGNTNVHLIGTFYSVQSAQRRIRAMLTNGRSQ